MDTATQPKTTVEQSAIRKVAVRIVPFVAHGDETAEELVAEQIDREGSAASAPADDARAAR